MHFGFHSIFSDDLKGYESHIRTAFSLDLNSIDSVWYMSLSLFGIPEYSVFFAIF